MLIAARSDRGTPRLTKEELDAFCRQRGIVAYLPTSAMAGEGIDALVERMKGLIPWDTKPATVTTETFKRIKDYVLELKENRRRRKMILTPEELRERLEKSKRKWQFTDAEMLTAVGHLANHGYVTRLKTSQGEPRILLAPELLNNLAASFVLEARRNAKGLGSLEEQKLLAGGYPFPELEKVTEAERAILLDSAAVLFLEHNVCFRETDLLGARLPRLPGTHQSEAPHRGRRQARGRRRGLHGQRRGGKCLCLAGGADGLHADLHPHEPMAEPRPLRGGPRTGLRLPPGSGARGRTGFRALFRHRHAGPGADAVPESVRELPGPPQSDRAAV